MNQLCLVHKALSETASMEKSALARIASKGINALGAYGKNIVGRRLSGAANLLNIGGHTGGITGKMSRAGENLSKDWKAITSTQGKSLGGKLGAGALRYGAMLGGVDALGYLDTPRQLLGLRGGDWADRYLTPGTSAHALGSGVLNAARYTMWGGALKNQMRNPGSWKRVQSWIPGGLGNSHYAKAFAGWQAYNDLPRIKEWGMNTFGKDYAADQIKSHMDIGRAYDSGIEGLGRKLGDVPVIGTALADRIQNERLTRSTQFLDMMKKLEEDVRSGRIPVSEAEEHAKLIQALAKEINT